jgi:hypothetical protein
MKRITSAPHFFFDLLDRSETRAAPVMEAPWLSVILIFPSSTSFRSSLWADVRPLLCPAPIPMAIPHPIPHAKPAEYPPIYFFLSVNATIYRLAHQLCAKTRQEASGEPNAAKKKPAFGYACSHALFELQGSITYKHRDILQLRILPLSQPPTHQRAYPA